MYFRVDRTGVYREGYKLSDAAHAEQTILDNVRDNDIVECRPGGESPDYTLTGAEAKKHAQSMLNIYTCIGYNPQENNKSRQDTLIKLKLGLDIGQLDYTIPIEGNVTESIYSNGSPNIWRGHPKC